MSVELVGSSDADAVAGGAALNVGAEDAAKLWSSSSP